MVSAADIERARRAVELAGVAVQAAEAMPPSETAGTVWGNARSRQDQAQAALERLLHQAKVDQAAAAARAKTEKTEKANLDAMAAELAAAAADLTTAAQAAQDALVAVLDAASAYDELVRQHAATLAGVGLSIADGEDHETGARRHDTRVRGTWYLRIPVREVLPWLSARVTLARLGRARGLINRPADRRIATMLADVTDVPPGSLPQPAPSVQPPVEPPGAMVLLPYGAKAPEGSTRHLDWRQMNEQREAAAAARATENVA
jgi:multidrug efflux pump subunit AcrA (membrane-fusion protein)